MPAQHRVQPRSNRASAISVYMTQYLALTAILAVCSLPALSAAQEQADEPAAQHDWTLKKLEKAELAAVKAYDRARWKQTIKRGEKALEGCLALFSVSESRCILIMKNNTVAYLRADKISEKAQQIEQAYTAAYNTLGFEHFYTTKTREVFHQVLLEQERYVEAIAIVKDLLTAEKQITRDEFKELDLLIQLYALYKVEGYTDDELPTLLRMAELTERLLGRDSEQLTRTITVLAQTYCEQKLYHEFYETVRQYQLEQSCR